MHIISHQPFWLAKQKFAFVFFGCGYCWELHFLVHIWLGTGAVLILVDKRGTALDWQATNLTDAVEQFWVQTWKFNHVNILNFNQLLSSMVYILETLQILKLIFWWANMFYDRRFEDAFQDFMPSYVATLGSTRIKPCDVRIWMKTNQLMPLKSKSEIIAKIWHFQRKRHKGSWYHVFLFTRYAVSLLLWASSNWINK